MPFLISFVFWAVGAGFFQSSTAEQTGCGTVGTTFGEAQCLRLSFAGELSAGQTFQRKFGGSLLFRLNPRPAHFGWTIEVLPEPQNGTVEREYIWVVTPPDRFYNPRDIDTSYGTTAHEAVTYSPRDFNFVLNEQQFKRAGDLVDLAIMSRPQSDQRTREELDKESEDAGRSLRDLPVSKGRLTILDSRVTAPAGDNGVGSIDWLKFAVELDVPCGFKPASGSDLTVDARRCASEEKQKN